MSYCSAIETMSGERKALHKTYHDQWYGFPLQDDNELFCRLVLEINQAGLSWETILKKEKNFRKAYHNFNIKKVAAYTEADRERLMADAGIIRNRLKINAAIQNAQAYQRVQAECGSFDAYVWGFVGGQPRQNAWASLREVSAKTPEAEALSKDLLKRGFKFVGPTICYAFMQATGMVNDHVVGCFRHAELSGSR